MLSVRMNFFTGRFHATPWGRNVNEGVPEWPPSPFRLARALMDVAHRKRPAIAADCSRLQRALAVLTAPASFMVPRSVAAHVRYYQRQWGTDPSDRKKIFDPFSVLEPEQTVWMVFDADVEPEVAEDVSELLEHLDYFGRSESWVSAGLEEDVPTPGQGVFELRSVSGSQDGGQTVTVACLRTETECLDILGKLRRRRAGGRRRGPKVPDDWLGAIALDTGTFLALGLSAHPAMVWRSFELSDETRRPQARRRRGGLTAGFREVRYALDAPVLPRVVDTLPVAEQVRRVLMGMHRKIQGGDPALVSQRFSGKDSSGRAATGHRHAFYWPLDEDRDGFIDHLIVRAAEPFDASELAAIDRLSSLWQRKNRPDVRLVLEALNRVPQGAPSRHFVSATPYVTSRHYKRGSYEDWVASELRRDCRLMGLPEPVEIEPLLHSTGMHPFRWSEYVRSRKGDRPLRGHGCTLVFEESVQGPFALGALAHFGLGLFVPASGAT